MRVDLVDGTGVNLEAQLDCGIKARKIDLRPGEIIVVELDELTTKYPLPNHAVG
jgi:hypothetical protein